MEISSREFNNYIADLYHNLNSESAFISTIQKVEQYNQFKGLVPHMNIMKKIAQSSSFDQF